MTTMQELFLRLRQEQKLKSLYRFQGKADTTSSIRRITVDENDRIFCFGNGHTIYLSGELKHHKYYVYKKLRTLINEALINRNMPLVCGNNIADTNYYTRVKKIIIESRKTMASESIELLITPRLYTLLRGSYVIQRDSTKKNQPNGIPELCDRRRLGGGYGLSGEWLTLLSKLTLFIGTKDIDVEDILNYLYQLRSNFACIYEGDTTAFINRKIPNVSFNESLYSSYHKYSIIESMERIVEQGIIPQECFFRTNPSQTIHEVIIEYTKLREEILRSLESSNNRKFNI